MGPLTWSALHTGGRRALLATLSVVGAGPVLFGNAEPSQSIPGMVVPGTTVTRAESPKQGAPDPRIDFPERATSSGDDQSLFAAHSWYVAPPPPPPVAPAAPPAPTAPPLPFTYLGSYVASGGGAVYYLVRGEQVFDVKVGDTVEGVYSVDAVQDDELMLTYLPLKQQQALSLRNSP